MPDKGAAMTNKVRREIKKLHKQGYTYKDLTIKYGVNKSSIRELIKGKR